MSKIGVHTIIGPRKNFGEYLRRVVAAGVRIPMIKSVDDFGPATEAKQLDPKVLTVGRLNVARDSSGNRRDMQAYEPMREDGTYVDARKIAEEYYKVSKPLWKANPQIDIWETFNEFSAHWGWQSDFYLAMMDLADQDGFKLSHYACSSGNPPNAATARLFIPCLKEAKKRGHYLSLHEYGGVGTDIKTLRGTQPFHALRYRKLYESILIPNNANPKLLLTEIGQDGGFNFLGTKTLIDDMRWYDIELARDDYVLGAAIFTLGKWYQSNFQDALLDLAEYTVSAANIKPPTDKPEANEPIFGTPDPQEPKPQEPQPKPKDPQPKPQEPKPEPKPQEPKPKPEDRPTPTRPVLTTRGAPRAQYRRNYLLLPNEPATPEGNAKLDAWLAAVTASGVLSRYRWTVGTSADDAGVGDLDRRYVFAINPETWPTSLEEFYTKNYPGVNYQAIQAATPDELKTVLANLAFG